MLVQSMRARRNLGVSVKLSVNGEKTMNIYVTEDGESAEISQILNSHLRKITFILH